LTVLTTKIRLSKPRVREEYTTSFKHIFYTNKVPQVVLAFFTCRYTDMGITMDKCVANMAPCAISSSLIFVIHDNMINGTNNIV
jgi:hypothetical protein